MILLVLFTSTVRNCIHRRLPDVFFNTQVYLKIPALHVDASMVQISTDFRRPFLRTTIELLFVYVINPSIALCIRFYSLYKKFGKASIHSWRLFLPTSPGNCGWDFVLVHLACSAFLILSRSTMPHVLAGSHLVLSISAAIARIRQAGP